MRAAAAALAAAALALAAAAAALAGVVALDPADAAWSAAALAAALAAGAAAARLDRYSYTLTHAALARALAAAAALAVALALATGPAHAPRSGACAANHEHRLDLAVVNLRTEATLAAAPTGCGGPTVRATIGFPPRSYTLALNFHTDAPAAVTLWNERQRSATARTVAQNLTADFLRAAAGASHRAGQRHESFARGVLVTLHDAPDPRRAAAGCDGALNLRPAKGRRFLARFGTALLTPTALALLPQRLNDLRGPVEAAGGALLATAAPAPHGWLAAVDASLLSTDPDQRHHPTQRAARRLLLWPAQAGPLALDQPALDAVAAACASQTPREHGLALRQQDGPAVPIALERACALGAGPPVDGANASLPWFALGAQIAVDAGGGHVALFPSNTERQQLRLWVALALTCTGAAVWLLASTAAANADAPSHRATTHAAAAHAETELKLIAVAALALLTANAANNHALHLALQPEQPACGHAARMAHAALAALATAYAAARGKADFAAIAARACRALLTAATAAAAAQQLMAALLEAAPRNLAAAALALWQLRLVAHFAAAIKHAAVYAAAADAMRDANPNQKQNAQTRKPTPDRDRDSRPRTTGQDTERATTTQPAQTLPLPALLLLLATAAAAAADLWCALTQHLHPTAAVLFPAYGTQAAHGATVLAVAAVAKNHAAHARTAARAVQHLRTALTATDAVQYTRAK
jgi:hypothetical protein